MKKILSLILIAVIALAVVSCGGKAASYKTDVPVATLAEAADKVIAASSGMTGMTTEYVENSLGIAASGFEEGIVKVTASGSTMDEYGIFKASSDDTVEALKGQVETYLKTRVDTWMPGCMPEEEHSKVENASVKVIGRYVVYGILSNTEKEAVFSAVEAELLAK